MKKKTIFLKNYSPNSHIQFEKNKSNTHRTVLLTKILLQGFQMFLFKTLKIFSLLSILPNLILHKKFSPPCLLNKFPKILKITPKVDLPQIKFSKYHTSRSFFALKLFFGVEKLYQKSQIRPK
jgi:hypothetical protein